MNKKVIVSIVAVIAIVALLGVFLVACNADSYQKKLDKKGYSVHVATEAEIKVAELVYGDIDWMVEGIKGSDEVTIVKFEKSDNAKKFADDMKELAKDEDNAAVKTIGKIVICGTKQGVKDAQ